MTHEAIPRPVRRQVRERLGDRCEYCQHPASFSCAPFVCEHVVPRVRGAGGSAAELGWACSPRQGENCGGTNFPCGQSNYPKARRRLNQYTM
jgi:hypothetical protein